jgi:hypothetical protein
LGEFLLRRIAEGLFTRLRIDWAEQREMSDARTSRAFDEWETARIRQMPSVAVVA